MDGKLAAVPFLAKLPPAISESFATSVQKKPMGKRAKVILLRKILQKKKISSQKHSQY